MTKVMNDYLVENECTMSIAHVSYRRSMEDQLHNITEGMQSIIGGNFATLPYVIIQVCSV